MVNSEICIDKYVRMPISLKCPGPSPSQGQTSAKLLNQLNSRNFFLPLLNFCPREKCRSFSIPNLGHYAYFFQNQMLSKIVIWKFTKLEAKAQRRFFPVPFKAFQIIKEWRNRCYDYKQIRKLSLLLESPRILMIPSCKKFLLAMLGCQEECSPLPSPLRIVLLQYELLSYGEKIDQKHPLRHTQLCLIENI